MATLEPRAAFTLTPAVVTSIQPGGGLCLNLERCWGKLRRAYLRRFRPGYVRLMASKRRGQCDHCPHDIIDTRDLMLYRNVCGYWFREEDDAFQWRNQLGLARPGLAEVVCFSLLFAVIGAASGLAGTLYHWLFYIPLVLVLPLWGFVISFFRDPQRVIPSEPAALVSPADGTVTHVDDVEEPDFPGGRAFRISIFLSVFDVHVNRIPRTGRVTAVRYFPGGFLDARHKESGIRNEQLWIDLEELDASRLIRVKQISGAIARRIVCWLKPDDQVQRGERFGMIKFGSRTDVLLPVEDVGEVKVQVGDKVKGGSSVLLRVATSRSR